MRNKKNFGYLLFLILFLASCEDEFVPNDIDETVNIVIEGHIEFGPSDNIPYVIVSKSAAFFSTLSPEQFEGLFINDAEVIVNDGDKDVILPPVCLQDLPPDLKSQIATDLGFESIDFDICIYADLLGQIKIEEGRSYHLNVKANEETLSATTTIPEFVPIENFWFRDPPGEPIRNFLALWATIDDPASQSDYYRYFTGNIGDPLTIPLQSVTDDLFFDGELFDFPLNKAEARNDEFDPNTFGLFTEGDTVIVKWCNIDKDHYDFWYTLEYALNSQGPFASYTRVKTNVTGGLGVWGGYACDEYELIVQK